MVFSSLVFLTIFLPIVLSTYFLLPRRFHNPWLLITSLIFYGWGEPRVVFIMLSLIVLDFFFGLLISGASLANWREPVPQLEPGGSRSRRQKMGIILSILSNCALLGFFKYS